jgi:hypothetical protein
MMSPNSNKHGRASQFDFSFVTGVVVTAFHRPSTVEFVL